MKNFLVFVRSVSVAIIRTIKKLRSISRLVFLSRRGLTKIIRSFLEKAYHRVSFKRRFKCMQIKHLFCFVSLLLSFSVIFFFLYFFFPVNCAKIYDDKLNTDTILFTKIYDYVINYSFSFFFFFFLLFFFCFFLHLKYIPSIIFI